MRVYVCAGEASGDQLGAHLVRALGVVQARGLAGASLRAAGVQAVANSSEATAAGLVEVVEAVPRIARLMRRLERDAVAFDPHVVLTIDSPGMMLRLGKRLRRRGMKVVHAVAPQVWAWRPGRVRSIAQSADALLCLFPHEPALFEGHCDATYIGHPALGTLPQRVVGDAVATPIIALCPGSRPAEIAQHWPALCEVARHLRRALPGCRFLVPVAPSVRRRDLSGLDATLCDDTQDLASADVAVACSGTLTLQLAVMRVPQVVIYRVHPATWRVGRRLVQTPWLSLPNNLAGRAVVPEVLQDLRADRIAAVALSLLGDEGKAQVQALDHVVSGLCDPSGTARAADVVRRVARLQG